MPGSRSTDTAAAGDRQRKPSPDSKADAKPLRRPFTNALLAVIADSGFSYRALARRTGVAISSILQFMRREKTLSFYSAEKLASLFGLEVVGTTRSPDSGSDGCAAPPTRTIRDDLLAAIADSGLSYRELAMRAGVAIRSIQQFIRHERSLRLDTADKLAVALGLVVALKPERPDMLLKIPNDSPTRPVSDDLPSAIADGGLDLRVLAWQSGLSIQKIRLFFAGKLAIKYPAAIILAAAVGPRPEPTTDQVRSDTPPPSPTGLIPVDAEECPIQLWGEGLPIRVHGEEVPPMTGIAYKLMEFAIEQFHQGGVCKGTELEVRTGTGRPIRLLMLKLKQPRFEPLARVLIWDARKGGSLRIIKAGPKLMNLC